MTGGTLLEEARQIERAISLIALGARSIVVTRSTGLSQDKVSRLFREVLGKASVKGQLPSSIDWFLTWQSNRGPDARFIAGMTRGRRTTASQTEWQRRSLSATPIGSQHSVTAAPTAHTGCHAVRSVTAGRGRSTPA